MPPQMTRDEVFAVVAAEDDYAERYDCKTSEPPAKICDDDKPLEQWLAWVRQYADDALKAATTGYNKPQALHLLRKLLSVGVNAAMRHGLPPRPPFPPSPAFGPGAAPTDEPASPRAG